MAERIITRDDESLTRNYSDLMEYLEKVRPGVVIVEINEVYRFQANKLFDWVSSQISLNDMREAFLEGKFDIKEYVYFYMDIGYSLCGFEDVWGGEIDNVLGIKRDAETGEEYERGEKRV